MSTVLDLDAIGAGDQEPSVVFTLGGREWHVRAKEQIHYGTVEGWLIAQATGDGAGIAANMSVFFSAVLFPDEVDDFLALKDDPKGPLTMVRMEALVQALVEQIMGVRPTEPPSA